MGRCPIPRLFLEKKEGKEGLKRYIINAGCPFLVSGRDSLFVFDDYFFILRLDIRAILWHNVSATQPNRFIRATYERAKYTFFSTKMYAPFFMHFAPFIRA